jgi:tRNA1Val (adenine37-N6)-methyltransferase
MTKEVLINSDETVDEYDKLKVIQKADGFRFSLDAVVLAEFATVKKGDKVIDLGAGNGIISLIIASKAEHITAVEIQPEMADLAVRNVILNGLGNKIKVVEDDLTLAKEHFPSGQFDVVITNPPYRIVGSGRLNPNDLKAIARHELKCTLDDVLRVSFHLLKERGRLAIVHRPDRLIDLIVNCRQYRLEPKRIQFIHIGKDQEASLVLVEAIKNGKPDLKVLSPKIIKIDISNGNR